MVFIVRQPGVEDTHNIHDTAAASGITTAVVHEAGLVMAITGDEKVSPVTDGDAPYGFLKQRVKNSYETLGLPMGYRFRGDFGSSDAFVGDPVGLEMSGFIADISTFDADSGGVIVAGQYMYAKDGGRLTNDSSLSVVADLPVAIAKHGLSANAIAAGKYLRIKGLV